ncbi:MAG: hypothetical protein AB2807_05570 [Candidatus Sedimenticola endophacoides]
MKDFGTSLSPKSTRQRDSRYCPDRPALITTPSRTLQQSCSCGNYSAHFAMISHIRLYPIP